jgi:hypothetical protein
MREWERRGAYIQTKPRLVIHVKSGFTTAGGMFASLIVLMTQTLFKG